MVFEPQHTNRWEFDPRRILAPWARIPGPPWPARARLAAFPTGGRHSNDALLATQSPTARSHTVKRKTGHKPRPATFASYATRHADLQIRSCKKKRVASMLSSLVFSLRNLVSLELCILGFVAAFTEIFFLRIFSEGQKPLFRQPLEPASLDMKCAT